jgi:hypothetical protein
MSDRVGDLQKRLMEAEVTGLHSPIPDVTGLLRDARHLIMNLDQERGSAVTRAAEVERDKGIPHSVRRIAQALEQAAMYGWGSVGSEHLDREG